MTPAPISLSDVISLTDAEPLTEANSLTEAEPLRSEFADDEDFAVILEPYLAGIDAKIQAMREAAEALPHDREPVRDLAHQIKGSAGGYGFPQVTEAAWATLVACKQGDAAAVEANVEELLGLMSRMSASCHATTG
ncbi:Hpt domain-containing protein [Alienimonas chondri]|uniref:HPt domain-containing protein n=1 Tax=Alienimonas chondri TaxID=2681879 RepID=A0ABX1VJS9_9PLAN|nr:Hpt domain-containing protein [Alienimonas chondri]NNJ27046.1 hypothetical protein [Alienimonas chondri]